MDLLHPFVGGALRSDISYKLISITDLKDKKYIIKKGSNNVERKLDDDLTSKDVAIPGNDKTGPQYALLLTNGTTVDKAESSISKFTKDQLDIVIGISWIAAMKLMGEYDSNKTFAQKFFNIEETADENEDPGNAESSGETNNRKATIIAFIHGVHAYALYKGVKMPDLSAPLSERFVAVINYLKNNKHEKNALNGIWNSLNEFYSNEEMSVQTKSVTEILDNIYEIDNFLKRSPGKEQQDYEGEKEGEEPVADDLSEIARYMSIHKVLFKR